MIVYNAHELSKFSGRAEEKHVIKIELSTIYPPHHLATQGIKEVVVKTLHHLQLQIGLGDAQTGALIA